MKKLRALGPVIKGPTVLAFLAVCQASSHWPIVVFAVCWLLQSSLAAVLDRLTSVESAGFKGQLRPPERKGRR
jgi:hypothetical protein